MRSWSAVFPAGMDFPWWSWHWGQQADNNTAPRTQIYWNHRTLRDLIMSARGPNYHPTTLCLPSAKHKACQVCIFKVLLSSFLLFLSHSGTGQDCVNLWIFWDALPRFLYTGAEHDHSFCFWVLKPASWQGIGSTDRPVGAVRLCSLWLPMPSLPARIHRDVNVHLRRTVISALVEMLSFKREGIEGFTHFVNTTC